MRNFVVYEVIFKISCADSGIHIPFIGRGDQCVPRLVRRVWGRHYVDIGAVDNAFPDRGDP